MRWLLLGIVAAGLLLTYTARHEYEHCAIAWALEGWRDCEVRISAPLHTIHGSCWPYACQPTYDPTALLGTGQARGGLVERWWEHPFMLALELLLFWAPAVLLARDPEAKPVRFEVVSPNIH